CEGEGRQDRHVGDSGYAVQGGRAVSISAPPAKWEEMADVGRIARAHGRRGQVIVNRETDFPERRLDVWAEPFVERRGRVARLMLAAVRFQHERPVIAVAGVDMMDAAEALSGLELRVPVERLTPLPEGSFYRHDLVGCEVETRAG